MAKNKKVIDITFPSKAHEAGHAVCLIKHKQKFDSIRITVHRDKTVSGHVKWWIGFYDYKIKSIERDIVCYMAGPVAELILAYGVYESLPILKVIKLYKGNESDWEEIKMLLEMLKKVKKNYRRERELLRLVKKTVIFVKKHRKEILCVTKMFKNRVVKYKEIVCELKNR